MNVNVIVTSEYPVGCDTKKAERKVVGKNFAAQTAQAVGQVRTATLHGRMPQSALGRTFPVEHPFMVTGRRIMIRKILYIK